MVYVYLYKYCNNKYLRIKNSASMNLNASNLYNIFVMILTITIKILIIPMYFN